MKRTIAVFFLIFFQADGHKSSNPIATSVNAFVARIDKILTHNNDSSSVLCPFNLHLGLSLLHQGAEGDTATELAQLLGLTTTKQEISKSYRSLVDDITGDSFKIWTCMIPGESFTLNQGFVDVAYQYFKAGAAGVTQNGNNSDADITLKYCNKIGSRPKSTKLQIFSKAGLNSSWKKPFPPAEEGDFTVTLGEKVKVMMMTQSEVFAYKEDPVIGAKILKLDYNEDGWSMLFVLPDNRNGGNSLAELQTRISENPLHKLLTNLKELKLEVAIPKFSTNAFNFHRDMKFLGKMGAKELFDTQADFSSISNGEQMHLSHVLIEAFISINETGTLAGSGADFLAGGGDDLPQLNHTHQPMKATSLATTSMASEATVPSFKADHPFLFYIIGPNYVFLYSGKIVNPTNQKR